MNWCKVQQKKTRHTGLLIRLKKEKRVKITSKKIFSISNIHGKYSNVSIIETKAVKIKVTIKCDMKTMSDNFYCSLKFTIQDNILKVSKKAGKELEEI